MMGLTKILLVSEMYWIISFQNAGGDCTLACFCTSKIPCTKKTNPLPDMVVFLRCGILDRKISSSQFHGKMENCPCLYAHATFYSSFNKKKINVFI